MYIESLPISVLYGAIYIYLCGHWCMTSVLLSFVLSADWEEFRHSRNKSSSVTRHASALWRGSFSGVLVEWGEAENRLFRPRSLWGVPAGCALGVAWWCASSLIGEFRCPLSGRPSAGDSECIPVGEKDCKILYAIFASRSTWGNRRRRRKEIEWKKGKKKKYIETSSLSSIMEQILLLLNGK